MTIIVSFTNFRNEVKDMIKEIADRLSIVQPRIGEHMIVVELETMRDIVILFKPALQEYVKGTRPDYYWTNSYDVDKYYRSCHDVKRLQNFTELTSLVLTECFNNAIEILE